jgi:RNA polymerase sigma-70 factor (ECF subfamily)
MSETSVSLLERLRQQPDPGSWQRLLDLYTPLIRGWLRRHGLQLADADDIVQEVLGVVVRELPGFQHDRRPGAFRCWLRTITVNRLHTYWRSRRSRPLGSGDSDVQEQLEQLEDPASRLSHLWDKEHDQHVLARLQELIEPEFTAITWRAFQRVTLDGCRAAEVAAELGISVNAVLLAKSRVLNRLRQEARGLID